MGCFSSKEAAYGSSGTVPRQVATKDSRGKGKDDKDSDPTGGLSQVFDVQHLLGSGSAGDTWLCRDKRTGEQLAVKLMKRPIPAAMSPTIMREVKIGAHLGRGHINIVKPKEVVLTRTHLGLIMEYVAGGNMADHILKTILLKWGSFEDRDGLVMEEDEARYYFIQVINAVEFCHRNKVAHRDLKMDNTLLDDSDPPRIKLCDFGFANWWKEEPNMSTIMGTPDYMAPQLLGPKASNCAASYDGTKADIWAAGVMLCVMLLGRFPFEGTDMAEANDLQDISMHVWRQINTQQWFANPLIAHDVLLLTKECVDLLNRIFELDESKRISIREIQQHSWFTKPLPQHYQEAIDHMLEEQRRINFQVASGAFVSKDRDRTLKEIVYLAATRWDAQQEELVATGTLCPQEEGPSTLRRVSLNAIKPYEYEQTRHADLATISKFFQEAAGGLITPEGSMHAHHAAAAAMEALQFEEQQRLQRQQQQQQQQAVMGVLLGAEAALNGRVQEQQQHEEEGVPLPGGRADVQLQQQVKQEPGHTSPPAPPSAEQHQQQQPPSEPVCASPQQPAAAAPPTPDPAAPQPQQLLQQQAVSPPPPAMAPPALSELPPQAGKEDQADRISSWQAWQAAREASATTSAG